MTRNEKGCFTVANLIGYSASEYAFLSGAASVGAEKFTLDYITFELQRL